MGEWVHLKLQPYQQRSLYARINMNLAQKFYGPFQIEERIRQVAYRLKLLETLKIQPTFHVSCLKKKLGAQAQIMPTLPPTDHTGVMLSKLESILER